MPICTPDDLSRAHVTQTWLATSDDPAAKVTGGYFYHQQPRRVNPSAQHEELQERLLDDCRGISGIELARTSPLSGRKVML
jgi:hypothetical protein